MTAIGALMGAGVLPIYPMITWAIVGAIVGDLFSFWLGSHLHQNVRNCWPFTRYPQVLIKGEAFFERHGGKSVFLGRFVGPIRPVIPLIAGMLKMKPVRFFIADIPAAIGWAPAYMLPGILLGELSLKLEPQVATQFLLAVFASLIILWLVYWLLKRLILRLINSARYLFTYIWRRFSPSQRWMAFMRFPDDPQNALQFRTFTLFLVLLGIFCLSVYSVMHQGVLTILNDPIFHFMRSLRSPLGDKVMNVITFFGAKQVMLAVSIVVLLYFVAKRNVWAGLHWFALSILSYGGGHLIKNWVQSPRPGSVFLSLYYGWSFPSGHTLSILTVFGFLAVLTTQRCSLSAKRWCYAAVAFLVTAVGISRIYLGFHWLSDVIGSIVLGLCIIIGITFSYRSRESEQIDAKSLWFVVIFTSILAWGIYTAQFLGDSLKSSVAYWPTHIVDEKVWWSQSKTEPPLYRINRFGKPVQVLNIQWAGDLQVIQKDLMKHGWKIAAKPDLLTIVASLTNEEKSNLNPIFLTRYYRDRKPALVMTKVVPGVSHPLLILRLWDSQIMLRKNGYTIWVGTVNYYRSWHSMLRRHGEKRPPKVAAIDYFKQDLQDFRWKESAHPDSEHPKALDETPYTLLVRSPVG